MNFAVFINHPAVPAWHFSESHASLLRSLVPGSSVSVCRTEPSFTDALREADAALTWVFRQSWFSCAPRLRYVSTPAAGKDYFQVDVPPGVTMLNGHFHGEIIAETVLGMLLGMARGVLPAVTTYSDCSWPRAALSPGMRTLRGGRVTILGFGHIGRWIGRLAKPFGVTVSGMVRNVSAAVPDWFTPGDRLFGESELESVLPETDHLVLALPSDTGTDGMLSASRLALLPSHATVVNIGRGNAVDEPALLAALRAGRLAGAALDVFWHEPLPADDPVRSCPRLWALPHASAIAPNYLELYVREVAGELSLRSGCVYSGSGVQ